jgi:hypothetical protein
MSNEIPQDYISKNRNEKFFTLLVFHRRYDTDRFLPFSLADNKNPVIL